MVFQPNRTDLPVMVWLPQGGFISDVTPLFQPEFLLAKDVVLVVLQHRLGVLGSYPVPRQMRPVSMVACCVRRWLCGQ